ncbi:hypothetical protein MMC14_001248 [Varicellaria rhodocarpa]|nr:hypothetical protein [Varicellaria rhodocarpa]
MMCYYSDGKLEKQLMTVSDTRYLAISHVWGVAGWLRVPQIDGELLVSLEKAKFIAEVLPSIVESDYFWMDILCVDQSDKAARIAVTQHIPTIFRSAWKTVMIRNGAGVRSCCVQAMGDLKTWMKDRSPCRERLFNHNTLAHGASEIEEAILSRLWVLQETILSDTIQFVRCDDVERRRGKITSEDDIRVLALNLMSMWASWRQYGSSEKLSDDDNINFLRAFLDCGSISRTSRTAHRPLLPSRWEFTMQLWSTHCTSKSRDFILAVMPQYSFYILPKDARSMTFSQLFNDCFHQLEAKCTGSWLAPLIMARVDSVTGDYSGTDNVPEPTYLGDLIKLCLGPRLKLKKDLSSSIPIHQTQGYRVQVEKTTALRKDNIIQRIQHCARNSGMLWTTAQLGELRELSGEVDEVFPQAHESLRSASGQQALAALKVLSRKCSNDRDVTSLLQEDFFQSVDQDVLVHTAALISCGLGLSAFAWIKQNFIPVFVDFRGMKFLALVPNSVLQNDDRHRFFLVEVYRYFGSGLLDSKRFGLLAWDQEDEPGSYKVCLFPPDLNLIGWKLWRNWI